MYLDERFQFSQVQVKEFKFSNTKMIETVLEPTDLWHDTMTKFLLGQCDGIIFSHHYTDILVIVLPNTGRVSNLFNTTTTHLVNYIQHHLMLLLLHW